MIMPMPVTGTTGPAGLLANVALANAEALSAIVVYQLAHPGRPMIYSSATGSMDFRSGAFLGGTPEMGIMSAALVTMGRFSLGLPPPPPAAPRRCRARPGGVIEAVTFCCVCRGRHRWAEARSRRPGLVLEQILVDDELGRLSSVPWRGRRAG
jgi:hypothetical protein